MDVTTRSRIAAGMASLVLASDMERCGAIVVAVDDANRKDVTAAVERVGKALGYSVLHASYRHHQMEVADGLAGWQHGVATVGADPMIVVSDADQANLVPSVKRVVSMARQGAKDVPPAAVVFVIRRGEAFDDLVEAVVDGVFMAKQTGVEVVDA